MADLRLVAPSAQTSTTNGGLGVLQWGNGRGSPVIPQLDQLVLRAALLVSPDLLAVAELRYDPAQRSVVDLLDAYVRYRPVSTSRWRWGVKAGAFFPPVSLENTGLGWSAEWTLTPSAINAWVGEELRILGGEASLEWRGDVDHVEFTAAAFGVNQPAGVALDNFGWNFIDRPLGLFDHVRMTNASNPSGAPAYASEFRQFDNRVGWYAGLAWERPDIGRLALLRYDNEADSTAHDATQAGWRTTFWSLGASTELGPVVILAQAMKGSTTIGPFGSFKDTTEFWAYYLLAGYEIGEWRFAARFDHFATTQIETPPPPYSNQHGVAFTTAVTWSPRKGVKLVGEVIAADYTQPLRGLIGKSPHVTETQAQLALRLSF